MAILPFLQATKERFKSVETAMTRRSNALIFLVTRFILMAAMVVGFAWTASTISP